MHHTTRLISTTAIVLTASFIAGCGGSDKNAAKESTIGTSGAAAAESRKPSQPVPSTTAGKDGSALPGATPDSPGAMTHEDIEQSGPAPDTGHGDGISPAPQHIPDMTRAAGAGYTEQPLPHYGVPGDEGVNWNLQDIPGYPNAVPGNYMDNAPQIADLFKGDLVQFGTTDSHDTVVDFYKAELSGHHTQSMSNDLPGGRKTAISYLKDGARITIGIQEYIKDGRVVITHMKMGQE